MPIVFTHGSKDKVTIPFCSFLSLQTIINTVLKSLFTVYQKSRATLDQKNVIQSEHFQFQGISLCFNLGNKNNVHSTLNVAFKDSAWQQRWKNVLFFVILITLTPSISGRISFYNFSDISLPCSYFSSIRNKSTKTVWKLSAFLSICHVLPGNYSYSHRQQLKKLALPREIPFILSFLFNTFICS